MEFIVTCSLFGLVCIIGLFWVVMDDKKLRKEGFIE